MSEALAKIQGEAKPIVQEAKSFLIKDDETFKEAGFRLKAIKDFLAQADKIFNPQIEAAHRSHQVALNQKKDFVAPIVAADKEYRKKRSDYEIALERKAEEERKKLEAQAREEEERKKKEMEESAVKAEAILGDPEAAQAIREAIPQVVVESASPAIAPQKVPEVEGFGSVTDYHIQIVNPLELIKAIAFGHIKVDDLGALITWKISELKAYIKRTGNQRIPGCLVEKKKVTKVF